jgi:hypothetical protein
MFFLPYTINLRTKASFRKKAVMTEIKVCQNNFIDLALCNLLNSWRVNIVIFNRAVKFTGKFFYLRKYLG